MENSLLVSLSQQLATYRAMDVIANNIANVSTPGFKRDSAKFEEYVAMMRPAEGQKGMQPVTFVKDAGVTRDTGQGNIEQTGAPLDLAISGKGYFAVQTPQACAIPATAISRWTADGNLVTSQGYQVQGDGGAITITPTDGDINIAPDGMFPAWSVAWATSLARSRWWISPTTACSPSKVPAFIPPARRQTRPPQSISGRARWKPPTSSR